MVSSSIVDNLHANIVLDSTIGTIGTNVTDRCMPIIQTIYSVGGPCGREGRSLYFSALNHSIISPLCLVYSVGASPALATLGNSRERVLLMLN